jgi:hypothetical protein
VAQAQMKAQRFGASNEDQKTTPPGMIDEHDGVAARARSDPADDHGLITVWRFDFCAMLLSRRPGW